VRIVREPFPDVISPASVVTIGKFDGVHLGHRAVLRRSVERARELGVEAAAVTFDRNPLALLSPEAHPPMLVSLDRRLELIAATGIDVVAVLTFDERRATEPAEDFVDELLVARLGVRLLLVGADFRFGANGKGDLALLRRLGESRDFVTELLPDVGGEGVDRISTSGIRRLIAEGRVAEAAARLGSLPAVTGRVVHGEARGRGLGFPTANLAADAVGAMPADGVYAGWLTIVDAAGDAGERLPAAISVSDNPTFDDVHERRIEAHVLDRELDLYGRTVVVEFVERIRGIERFDSVEALVERMHTDVDVARELLAR